MRILLINLLFVAVAVTDVATAVKLNKIRIKSHTFLTYGIIEENVKRIYDGDRSAHGRITLNNVKFGLMKLDLGKNYIIEKVVILFAKFTEVNVIVGNRIENGGSLVYDCTRQNKIVECVPQCRSVDPNRNGIFSREILLNFTYTSDPIDINEVEVFSVPYTNKREIITANRYVSPDNCQSKSWLLTQSDSKNPLPHKAGTKIFLDKWYIITEVRVRFDGKSPDSFELQLNGDSKNIKPVTVKLTGCIQLNRSWACPINLPKWPVRIISIMTGGVVEFSARGQNVFKPGLKTSLDRTSDRLRVDCSVTDCNQAVHSDCTEATMKAGVQFRCNNKRLLRLPTEIDKNVFVIVNNGRKEDIWKTADFTVDSAVDSKDWAVSMPKSYQYYGQYVCSCLIDDANNSELLGTEINFDINDFVTDVIINMESSYKLEDNKELPWTNVPENVIALAAKPPSEWIPLKISVYSLLNEAVVSSEFFDVESNKSSPEKFPTTETIYRMAFPDISVSWKILLQNYTAELFPDFSEKRPVTVTATNGSSVEKRVVKFVELFENEEKAFMWFESRRDMTVLKIYYSYKTEANLTMAVKTCTGRGQTQKLSTVTNMECRPPNKDVSCVKVFKNANLITFAMKRDLSKYYTFAVNLQNSNVTLSLPNVTAHNVDDVSIKATVIKLLSDDKVEVEFAILSKVVKDFIQCGNVIFKVSVPGTDDRQMVVQKPNFNLEILIPSKMVEVTVKLNIEGLAGSYNKKYKIINPIKAQVESVKYDSGVIPKIMWTGIDESLSDVLIGYEVESKVTVVACGKTTKSIQIVKKDEIEGEGNRYKILLTSMAQKHKANISLSIRPLFSGGKKGQAVFHENENSYTARTILALDPQVFTSMKEVTVTPGQADIECSIDRVNFTLEALEMNSIVAKFIKIGDGKYKIDGLIPGRSYRITAVVIYKSGLKDFPSESLDFQTLDDISIPLARHVAMIDSKVNIPCTAEVGPDDSYRKSIEWRKANQDPLPVGVKSKPDRTNPKIAYLVIEKVFGNHSGEYGCFVNPRKTVTVAKLTIFVDDLKVKPSKMQVKSFPSDNMVEVVCYSSVFGNTDLIWTDPDNKVIPPGEGTQYSLKAFQNYDLIFKAILKILKPSLETSGKYQCHQKLDYGTAVVDFWLFANEGIEIVKLSNKTDFIGDKTKLQCRGKPGMKVQRVVWESLPGDHNFVVTYPDPMNKAIQDIEFVNTFLIHQVTCRLEPSIDVGNPTKKSMNIVLESKVVIEDHKSAVANQDVRLTCIGYPSNRNAELQWLFYKNNSTKNVTILNKLHASSSPKGVEPMKMELLLPQFKVVNNGRYECKFASDMRSAISASRSVSLSVLESKSLMDSGKGAHSLSLNQAILQLMVLVAAFIIAV